MNACRIKRPFPRLSTVIATFSALVSTALIASSSSGASLYESAAVGLTGVTWQQLLDTDFLGANVSSTAFNGSRFYLASAALVERVGVHIAGPTLSPTNEVFAAIVRLDGATDFPDSNDLSAADVLGATLIPVPQASVDAYGTLRLSLDPGWWGFVVGSGRFGAFGRGGALLNNTDIGDPSNFGFILGAGWGPRPGGMRFIVEGTLVPEPSAGTLTTAVVVGFSIVSARRWKSIQRR